MKREQLKAVLWYKFERKLWADLHNQIHFSIVRSGPRDYRSHSIEFQLEQYLLELYE